jgi:hypothetical protein
MCGAMYGPKRQPYLVPVQRKVPGKYGDAITAEMNRGEALGFYVQRSESGKPGDFTANITVEQIDQEIVRILAQAAIQEAAKPDTTK